MFNLNGWKVRTWIGFGFFLMIFLSVLSAVLVFLNASAAREKYTEFADERELSRKINDLAIDLQILSRATRGYLLEKSEISKATYNEAVSEIWQLLPEAKDLASLEGETEALNELEQLAKDIQATNDRLIALVDRGQVQEAINLWKQDQGRDQVEEITTVLANLRKEEEEKTAIREEEISNELNQLRVKVLGLSLLSSAIAIGMVLFLVGRISEIMGSSANTVASYSSQIASTLEEQERSISQQAASVNETTTTMDELSSSSQKVTEQAEEAANSANYALSLSDEGASAVDRTIQGMGVLKEKVNAIADQILRLSEQTNQIGNISSLVSDLANQTNMLALNAAVEAVRAGEHGKGFAVVAAEIRKLADQSKRSAEKINGLVTDIQGAINSTVMVTDEGTKTVESSVQIARETSSAFQGVSEAINNVVLNNQQIVLSIKQQAIAIQQILEAMNTINSAAKESSLGISQVREGTQRLNDAAVSLKEAV